MPIDSPPHNALERIDPILEHLDFEASLHNLKENWAVNAIDDGDGSEQIKVVYTYARPEYAVAQAISDGASPEAALREWQASIHKMLDEFRPKRPHNLLVEAISALRYADSKDAGQDLDWSPDDDQDTLARIGRFSPIDLALATLTVYQTRDIKDLLGELAPITAPLPGWDMPPHLDLKRIQESLKVSHQGHEFLQEENEFLLLQLHQVQEELEQYYLRNLELERKTPGREPEKEKPSVRDLERRVQLIENSTSWRLTAPLRLFSKILSRKKGPNAAPEASAPEDKRIRYLQRRIEQLETSTSWRITAPLRAVGLLFKGRPGTHTAFFPRSRRKLALEEANKQLKALESQLSQESDSRRKAEQLAAERTKQIAVLQSRLTEGEESLAQLTTERDEHAKRAAQLAAKAAQEAEARTRTEKLAEDCQRELADQKQQLERARAEDAKLQARQTQLEEELIKAEAQIDLIKDLLLKDEDL